MQDYLWKIPEIQYITTDFFQASWKYKQVHPTLKLPQTAEWRTLLYSGPHYGKKLVTVSDARTGQS